MHRVALRDESGEDLVPGLEADAELQLLLVEEAEGVGSGNAEEEAENRD